MPLEIVPDEKDKKIVRILSEISEKRLKNKRYFGKMIEY